MWIGIQAVLLELVARVELLLLLLRERDLRGEQGESGDECKGALHAAGSFPK